MARIQGYNVVIKPALIVLVGSCITGAVAIPWMKSMPDRVNVAPVGGYLYPELWKFETKRDSVAEIMDADGKPLTGMNKGREGLFKLDLQKGVTVRVSKTTGQENIYLRNGFNLAEMKNQRDLLLRFEAHSTERFPILLAIRDFRKPVWHQVLQIEGDWHLYEMPLPLDALSARDNTQMVFAIQLGAQTGTVGLRHVELVEDNRVRK